MITHEVASSPLNPGNHLGPIFELHDVSRRYGRGNSAVDALKNVSLRIDQGEFVVIAGPSGSGKSTLLQLLGALDRPTSGRVVCAGRDLASLSDSQLSRLRRETIGFIFQQFNLIPTLSALDNVEVALAPTGLRGAALQSRARELLNAVGLSHRTDHLPSQLSGGEQQRVAIARALSNRPAVLLADEPTGNLDSTTGEEVLALLRELSEKSGQTVVIITHDLDIASQARHVVRIRNGRVVSDG